jgi:Tfp pilus assembly protein PilV
MVAMIILAIGITGAMRVVGMTSLGSAQARDTMLASTLALETMNEITASPTLATGTDSGSYSADYPGYRWESVVQESPEAETGLLDVTVTVYWPNGKTESRLNVTTSVIDPATQTTTDTATGSNTGTDAGTTGPTGTP